MSQISKTGKSLSRKLNVNNDTRKKKPNKNVQHINDDSCKTYDSFFSSSVKHEKKGDDSLLSVDTPLKYGSSSTKSGEDIAVSNETEKCLLNNSSLKKGQLQGKTQTSDSKNMFQDEKIIDKHATDVFSFKKKSKYSFEDSAFVFKSVDNSESNKPTSCQISDGIEDHGLNIDSNSLSDDDVPISDPTTDENILDIKNTTFETIEEPDDKIPNQCPICFKTVTKYINHMKSCASKNNLTTQQLLSVLKLHKKQLAERKELGLGPPVSSFRAKVSPKRSKAVDKKKPLDSNLQLALALSASLHSAEEDELIQEAEALKEAGLTEEADKKLSTLEKFGFASDFPCGLRTGQGSSKSRFIHPSLLLKRSKEDRERIVTEKVAIILINEEESTILDTFVEKRPSVKSKRLLKLWTEDCVLWHKAQCSSEEQRSAFYIQSLSEFIEPSTAEVGDGLRRLSQLPGRLNTPEKYDTEDIVTPPRMQSFSGVKTSLSSASTIRRSAASHNKTNQLSEDWGTLVGNTNLSDVCLQCDEGEVVPAHKLVFYVRCPSILSFAESQSRGLDKIVLENCSKTAAIAFLEFVYTGISRKMLYLSSQELETVISLANKFNYDELKNELVTVSKCRENIEKKKSGRQEVSKELFVDPFNTTDNHEDRSTNSLSNSTTKFEYPIFESNVEPDNLHCSNSSSGRGSPDMFGDSVVLGSTTNSPERDDLDILASLVGKTTGVQHEDNSININKSCVFDEIKDSSNTLSLSGTASVKRKVSSSFSEDENASSCKKVCSDLTPKNISGQEDEEKEILDLTQSSNSSKSKTPVIDQAEFEDDNSDDCKIVSTTEIQDDGLENLTQQYSSSSSLREEVLSPTRDSVESLKNEGPMWDLYEDDYWYYNHEVNTPGKISMESPEKNTNTKNSSVSKSVELTKMVSTQSPTISPGIKNISSDSKSSSKSKNYPTPNSSPGIKSLSSKDRSLSNSSQKTLDLYLSQNSIEKRHSMSNSIIDLEEHSPDLGNKSFKAKKNLSSQFYTVTDVEDAKNYSFSSVNTENHKASPFKSVNDSPKCNKDVLTKTPTTLKKDSLAAMQRLLDDSFEVNDSILASADALSSKRISATSGPSTSVVTDTTQTPPAPQLYVSDKVTPLPEYSSMKTPALKGKAKPSFFSGISTSRLILLFRSLQARPRMCSSSLKGSLRGHQSNHLKRHTLLYI